MARELSAARSRLAAVDGARRKAEEALTASARCDGGYAREWGPPLVASLGGAARNATVSATAWAMEMASSENFERAKGAVKQLTRGAATAARHLIEEVKHSPPQHG